MIGRLKGVLLSKQPPWLLVDVAGVGYELEVPMSTFYELPEVGREVVLCTHYAVRDDSVALYGFHTEAERRLFRSVQKVSGIGARVALSILSGTTAEEFSRLVQGSDIKSLMRIPGIGKKTAERIIVELRDRIEAMVGGASIGIGQVVAQDPVSEASVALQALGYKPAEVSKLVRDAAAPDDSAEDIIRKALRAALR